MAALGGAVPEFSEFDVLVDVSRLQGWQQSEEAVVVECANDYARLNHADEALERQVESCWREAKAKRSKLYNGAKFRYEDVMLSKEGYTHFKLGLTDYRELVGTSISPKWRDFLVNADSSRPIDVHLSNAIGNGVVVWSRDNRAICLRRSFAVGEGEGMWHFAGGHPEPENVDFAPKVGDTTWRASTVENESIRAELFNSVKREIKEELGIESEHVVDLRFLGVVRRRVNRRYQMSFVAHVDLDANEIVQGYHCGEVLDRFETTQITSLTLEEIQKGMPSFMPGCHEGLRWLFLSYATQSVDCA